MKFEQWLQEKHMAENPCIFDDDLSDAYDNWLSIMGYDKLIEYAEEWQKELASENAILKEKFDKAVQENISMSWQKDEIKFLRKQLYALKEKKEQ